MQVEQFVMAYYAEQDRLRALLPEGFVSLRPVLRINAEVRDGVQGYVEFNTAVEKDGQRGWLNLGHWDDAAVTKEGKTTLFAAGALRISFTGVGIEGGCPAEKDNAGCFFTQEGGYVLHPAEAIDQKKEFCDCEFSWEMEGGAHGVSEGKNLHAVPTQAQKNYPKEECTVENAARIPCRQVLGTYRVQCER